MTNNWICSQCDAYNPQQRDQCWNCGFSQRGIAPVPIAVKSPERSKTFRSILNNVRNHWRIGIVVGLILVPLGHVLIQYLVDRGNYNEGHAAYQQVRCGDAIEHYTKLIEDWRLINLGGFPELAEAELAECIPFQAAENQILNGYYDVALMDQYGFIHDFYQSNLKPHSQQRVELLFTSVAPEKLAGMDTCLYLDAFLEEGLIPKTEMVLPPMLFYCGQLYAEAGNIVDAFEFQKRLLVEYPNHNHAPDSEFALLSNPISCREIDSIEALPPIANRSGFMPSLYFNCAQYYYDEGKFEVAVTLHAAVLANYPNHILADTAEEFFLTAPEYCNTIGTLDEFALTNRPGFLPKLYSTCGQVFEGGSEFKKAVNMYSELLIRYPDHNLADAAEESFLTYLEYCDLLDTLDETILVARPGIKTKLYRQCGDYHYANQDFDGAVQLYEQFLAEFPNHKKSHEVEISLAKAILDRSKQGNPGEIIRPERSGTTAHSDAIVIIQNVSPQRVRIVFSGPETRIEELDACSTCEEYSLIGPSICPDKGPIGSYTLTPGAYDVVVEASSDSGVIPFTGLWELISGDEYSNCFYIVKTFTP